MNVDELIEDAVMVYNETNPDIIIRRNHFESVTFYFLYLDDSNVWDSEECQFFLNLKGKLSEARIYPYIGLHKVFGEEKIGICINLSGAP